MGRSRNPLYITSARENSLVNVNGLNKIIEEGSMKEIVYVFAIFAFLGKHVQSNPSGQSEDLAT